MKKNNETIQAIDSLARERGIDPEHLYELIEESVKTAAKKSISQPRDVDVKFNRETGQFQCWSHLKVVEKVEDPATEISLAEIKSKLPQAQVGDEIDWEETPEGFGRIAAQTAKQVIFQRLKQIEKQNVCDSFRDQLNHLISGVVRKTDHGDVIIDFGSAEGVMRNADKIPKEIYEPNDHITALLTEINSEHPGPSLFVTRATPEFVVKLFELEVTEIRDGQVEIKGVSRDPGYRTKIAVYTEQPRIDPVGACVGLRGMRVRNIVRELGGEKIDIINWDPDIRVFAANALKPAKLASIAVDEKKHQLNVKVTEDQLSLSIGKRGQNVRLAMKLTGWNIDISKLEETEQTTPQDDFAEQVRKAIEALANIPAIGPEAAEILVHSGFATVEGIKAAEEEDLAQLDGIGKEKAQAIFAAVQEL
ncbi:MAG: transcription termination factor NusA [Victivallales bacterium]|nr:transcription termination factor NusA [Victivallales bacterium]